VFGRLFNTFHYYRASWAVRGCADDDGHKHARQARSGESLKSLFSMHS
jgi:hypothetical protein